MKIRNKLEFQDSLQHDIKWRKREFTTIKFMVAGAKRDHEKIILQKAAIVMLYSHWEGHIKHCSLAYLNYLNNIGCCYSKMKENFLLLSLYEKFNKGFSLKKISSLMDLHSYLSTSQNEKFKVNENIVIDTDSNLKFPILSNILKQLGLNIGEYELRENFINSTLVTNRNIIAHGDILNPNDINQIYNEIESELLNMIMTFNNLVSNAVARDEYLKDAS